MSIIPLKRCLQKDRESRTSTSNDDELILWSSTTTVSDWTKSEAIGFMLWKTGKADCDPWEKGSRQDESHVCWFLPGDNFPTAGDPKQRNDFSWAEKSEGNIWGRWCSKNLQARVREQHSRGWKEATVYVGIPLDSSAEESWPTGCVYTEWDPVRLSRDNFLGLRAEQR